MRGSNATWEKVGHIDVDAGIVWIGDPCYVMHGASKDWGTLGQTWRQFCDYLHEKIVGGVASFGAREDTEGLGICVQTAHGDGAYPVYVKRNRHGGVSRVIIKFE